MSDRSTVRVDETPIEYAIVRSARRRTVAICIDPVEGVQVRAPRGTSVRTLDGIVRRRADWILERRRRLKSCSPRTFTSGETFRLFGRELRLQVESADRPCVRLRSGQLVATVPGVHDVRETLIDWFRERASAQLPEIVERWSELTGLRPSRILIRNQRRRWGSANARGELRLNWRIVQAPREVVDYVVVHELVHLRHMNHGAAYWDAVEEIMPDYERRREALKTIGPSLFW